MSIFQSIGQGPPIEVFALNKLCLEDPHPDKVNLGVGGKSIIFFIRRNVKFFFGYVNDVTNE